MNKRQARIEALKTIVGILDTTDIGTFDDYLNDEDSIKSWVEFVEITDALRKRWQKMEANQKAA
jgi:hypothetical protein